MALTSDEMQLIITDVGLRRHARRLKRPVPKWSQRMTKEKLDFAVEMEAEYEAAAKKGHYIDFTPEGPILPPLEEE